ncbi:hypothetical protein [Labilithrix luteola]|uniref:hypothetical protein n=1 Tax=Labilithrix luteola TaxID=1391654 RepID=UPI0011BAA097|nr:hypothetical protein [Labilithrix luteola]
MRTWIVGALIIGSMTISAASVACPVGIDDGASVRPIRPVVDESQNVSVLFERARTLDSLAAARENDATRRARDAETLTSRARLLRLEAQRVSSSERSDILAVADDLELRAASNRAQARELRLQAAEFRTQAATLRERATVLARNGGRNGGWGRPRPLPRPVPVVASETIL